MAYIVDDFSIQRVAQSKNEVIPSSVYLLLPYSLKPQKCDGHQCENSVFKYEQNWTFNRQIEHSMNHSRISHQMK